MTKTKEDSFIVWCTSFSDCAKKLNSDAPVYYDNKYAGFRPVCILQTEVVYDKNDNYRDCVLMFELIYKE